MKKILVAEDSASTRRIICDTLRGGGYQVDEVENGAEALVRLQHGEIPDLLLTDINMPRLDGLALLQQLRQVPGCQFLPSILLTTESGDEKRSIGKASGATAWMVKPFDPSTLLRVVERVLR